MRTFLALFFLFFSVSCNNNNADKKTVEIPKQLSPQYYFYPKANVYFDSANKNYVFLTTDGKTWQTVKGIPAAMQLLMDKSILIDTPANPVWKDNERHKLIYSALLYASPSDTQITKEVKPLPKPVVIKQEEVKKKKSGLKKFLEKIFGKKKKDSTKH